jgi:hypothetical protein
MIKISWSILDQSGCFVDINLSDALRFCPFLHLKVISVVNANFAIKKELFKRNYLSIIQTIVLNLWRNVLTAKSKLNSKILSNKIMFVIKCFLEIMNNLIIWQKTELKIWKNFNKLRFLTHYVVLYAKIFSDSLWNAKLVSTQYVWNVQPLMEYIQNVAIKYHMVMNR